MYVSETNVLFCLSLSPQKTICHIYLEERRNNCLLISPVKGKHIQVSTVKHELIQTYFLISLAVLFSSNQLFFHIKFLGHYAREKSEEKKKCSKKVGMN